MAKASERDIEMALELSRAIEALGNGYYPDSPDQDIADDFDASDAAECRKAIDMLLEIACKGSLFRVVFGMAVVLDPRNEVVDPDADHLELHPTHKKAHEQRDELLAALKQYADDDNWCYDTCNIGRSVAQEAIAKAEGGTPC